MKTAPFALALFLLLTSVSIAAPRSVDEILEDIDIPYEKHILPNGLTLIIHEDHKAPIVAVSVWYHVGSKNERPGRTGFAHLFEHLMFNGSEHYNDEFFRPLQAAGATAMNGTTSVDRTNYYQNVPTSALDLALWMESDRMGHLLGVIDQAKLDEQRGVVQNEKRQRENQPYGKVHEIIATNTYPPGHPYSWTTIGSMEDLNAATLEDVHEWFKTWYGAANAVLVLAGDVNPEEARKKVEHYFGDIPPGPPLTHPKSWVAKMSGEKRMVFEDDVPHARIYKVWNVPGTITKESALLGLAGYVLSAGKNSRLYKRLVYTDQIATSVSAGADSNELGSHFMIVATVKEGVDVQTVEKAIDEELARFLAEGPTEEELERVRSLIYTSMIRSRERVDAASGRSAILAYGELYADDPGYHKQEAKWLFGASRQEVQAAAQEWLSDGVFVLHVLPRPKYQVAQTGADRSKLPEPGEPPALDLPPLQRTTLSNGLNVVLAERHDVPVVQLQLLIDAGYAADSLSKPGTAQLTMAMLDEGTKNRDALQIAAEQELLGASIGAGSGMDTSYVFLSALKANLNESLALFADVLLHPAFPEAELARLKSQALAGIRQAKAHPQGIIGRLLPPLIYGEGHPYANPSAGTEESVGAMTVEDLRSFYRQWVRPDNATMLVVGDTTLSEIKPLLEKHLKAWRAPDLPLLQKKISTVELPSKPRVYLVHQPNAQQSTIVAAHPAPLRSDPDYLPMTTVAGVLGGGFTSRLNMNLRETKHWSYGAGAQFDTNKGPGIFAASASVQTDKTAEAMAEILRELQEVRTSRRPDTAEIKDVINRMTLTLPGRVETVSGVAGMFQSILVYGLPEDYWDTYVTEANRLTEAQVHAAAEKLVKPDALTWLVVGDLEKIEEKVRALGLGEVQVLGAEGNVLR